LARLSTAAAQKGKQIHVAEDAAQGWTDDEAESKRRADKTELLGAFFRGSDVCDVCERGGDVGRGDSRNEAANE
jgi:hypothetical protein